MKKLIILFVAAAAFAGCSVKKVEFERKETGAVAYRIYENDHWLKTESTGLRGGMTQDGKFEFEAEGMKSSPSEEFNRTMQTYTTAFVQLAQIVAAAYNPSSTGVQATKAATTATATTTATAPLATTGTQTQAATSDCATGTCTTGTCTDGACSPAAK